MKNLVIALFGLALISGAFAASNSTGPDVLGLKYGILNCRVDAVIGLVEYGQNISNVSGGSGLAGKLATDMETLKGYADGGDRAGFNEFVTGNLKNDVKDSVFYLKDVKRDIMKNKRGPAGRDAFNEAVRTRAQCIQGIALNFSQTQVDEIETHLANMNSTIDSLKSKNVSTSKLESIEYEGEQNAAKLRAAVDSGNVSDIYGTAKGIREEHLHIWARFHIEATQEVLDAVSADALAKGYNAEVDSITALLNDASNKVQVGRPYNPGEFEIVKSDLNQARDQLRALIKKTRGA